MPEEILIDHYDYKLPLEYIAQHAAEPRDSSRLLIYKQGKIGQTVFKQIDAHLPSNAALFFNNAKVIPARIFAKTAKEAAIEIFLLQPADLDYYHALQARETVSWNCLIGNKKKWRMDEVLKLDFLGQDLEIYRIQDNQVRFEWPTDLPFVEVLDKIGKLPLPPYIKHQADSEDEVHYQTVYSSVKGSVAAPTAGLHFSNAVLSQISDQGIGMHYLTLHVGAGTFLPVKEKDARKHPMHKELFSISKETLSALKNTAQIIPVGTTACRVLESVYWIGFKLANQLPDPLRIAQFEYETDLPLLERKQAIDCVLEMMVEKELHELNAETAIMIAPGYQFTMTDGLITNFHQPKSTLLLLISALIGEDWKKVYQFAIQKKFRFLSYGDSSLLLPKRIF